MQRLEVNSENTNRLFQLLQTSSLGGPDVAECLDTLKNLDTMVGFRSCLLTIATNDTAPVNIRVFALSYFKNTITPFWNRNNSSSFSQNPEESEAERSHIKSVLLNAIFNEQNPTLANILADSIARIAKVDFPVQWDAIVPAIMEVLNSSVSLTSSNPSHALYLAHRAFDTLDLLLESLVSKRLMSSRQQFQDHIINHHFTTIQNTWFHYVQLLLQTLSSFPPQPSQDFLKNSILLSDTTHLATKCILHCVSAAASFIVNGSVGNALFPVLAETMTRFSQALVHVPVSSTDLITLRNNINLIRGFSAQAVTEAQRNEPIGFRTYIGPFLSLYSEMIKERANVRNQELNMLALEHSQGEIGLGWCEEDEVNEEAKGNDMPTIQAVNFITSVLVHPSYRNDSDNTGGKVGISFGAGGITFDPAATAEAAAIVDQFASDSWCQSMVVTLVESYLPWSRYDFELWSRNPEELFHKNKNDVIDVDERRSVESLIIALSKRKTSVVNSVLRDWLSSIVKEQTDSNTLIAPLSLSGEEPMNSTVLLSRSRSNALLLAIGHLLFDLRSVMDIAPILEYIMNILQQIVSAIGGEANLSKISFETHPSTVITLQRCAWIAGQFTDVAPNHIILKLAMQIGVLGFVNDRVVKLFTVSTLHSFIDSIHIEEMAPHMAQVNADGRSFLYNLTHTLLSLTQEVQLVDSKSTILLSLRIVIENFTQHIVHIAPLLVDALPNIWQMAEDERLVRQQIVRILSSLALSLGGHSQLMQAVFTDILNVSIDMDYEDGYLLIDGLELWANVLDNCTEMTPALSNLFERWIQIYSTSEEEFETAARILEAYIVMGRDQLLAPLANQLGPLLLSLITMRLSEENIGYLLNAIELGCQLAPSVMITQYQPILATLVEICHKYTLNPEDMFSSVTITYIYQCFAHLFISDPHTTLSLVNSVTMNGQSLLPSFINQYVNQVDAIEHLYQRKRAAMALAQLLPLDQSGLAPSMSNCFNFILSEIEEDEVAENQYKPANIDVPDHDKTKQFRFNCIANNDPSNQGRLREWVSIKMKQTLTTFGEDYVKRIFKTACRNDLLALINMN